jgi:hypothetical protein
MAGLRHDLTTKVIPGLRLIDGEDISHLERVRASTAQVMANPLGGAAGASQLVAAINEIIFSPDATGSCMLPPAHAGTTIIVMNHVPNPVVIYAATYNPLTGAADQIILSSSIQHEASMTMEVGVLARFISPRNGLWKLDLGGAPEAAVQVEYWDDGVSRWDDSISVWD